MTQLSHTRDKQLQITAHGDFTRDFIAQTCFFLKTSSFIITDLGLESSYPKFCPELWPSDDFFFFFFLLIQEGAQRSGGCSGSEWDRALDTPGDTWRPVPAHSHLSAPGCRWEPQSGCVWKTASRNPGEPHFHKGTRWRHSACRGKGNTRNNGRQVISQVLTHYDQPGTDNKWSTSCWWNRNSQVAV